MNYVFPSDQDRADNEQLNEACEYIEHLLQQPEPSSGVLEGQVMIPREFLTEYLELLEGSDFKEIHKLIRRTAVESLLAIPTPEAGQGAEPVAILRREIGESSWFDHTPVKPNSREAEWLKASPILDYCEVYTHPQPAQQGSVPEELQIQEIHTNDGEIKSIRLPPCPLCGSQLQAGHVGNSRTKSPTTTQVEGERQ